MGNIRSIYETNRQCPVSGEVLDPAADGVEGRLKATPDLDLLSDLAISSPPEIDLSNINGFDATKHVGEQFVREDKQQILTETKIIEVDDDTGKILLEYIHGGLEWVEPNVVQEALLSR